jgi:hypothetical protein
MFVGLQKVKSGFAAKECTWLQDAARREHSSPGKATLHFRSIPEATCTRGITSAGEKTSLFILLMRFDGRE